jgi:hypothetical protein
MRASLAACAVLAGCTFTPNPGAALHDANPGSEPAPGIDAAHGFRHARRRNRCAARQPSVERDGRAANPNRF